jgi:transglutaminase-like putative cysteine protease
MTMQIKIGCQLTFECPQPTPMILMLNVHHSRVSDLVAPDHVIARPSSSINSYRDSFGNWCTRLIADAGTTRVGTDAVIHDSGQTDVTLPGLEQVAVEHLPSDTLMYLMGSRYCETDSLSETAWQLFGHVQPGWARVQAICDYVHNHIQFGYAYARSTRTATEAFHERRGVCRDYTHLAVAFCRCMNIPARYCTGYLGDIGVPASPDPMDFSAWFEAYLGNAWYPFDPRNNRPSIGRVLIARGRDAADVPISNAFGPHALTGFDVWTYPVSS